MRAWIAIALLAPSIAAAEIRPISEVPSTGARISRREVHVPPGIEVDSESYASTRNGCLVSGTGEHWIEGDDDVGLSWRTASGASSHFGVERLVMRGDKMVVERTMVSIGTLGTLAATERGRIPVIAVAAIGNELAVYAFRRGNKIFLFAPTLGTSTIRIDSDAGDVRRSTECTHAVTQLRIVNGSSQATQILGALDVEETRGYVIDASVSKTSRDPEPLLSVTARLRR